MISWKALGGDYRRNFNLNFMNLIDKFLVGIETNSFL